MVKVKKIVLDRAEGPSSETGVKVASSFEEADQILRRWSHTSPKGGGYDKVDFTVYFEDGETYNGRYDMVHMDPGNLRGHIRNFLEFNAGLWRPEHLTQKQYDEYLERTERRPGAPKRQDYIDWMAKYLPGGSR